ncbi:MAG: ABC transporter permease [Fuerstia sp.]|nr:ABC transporter permease [Fuerstiella sp.]
MKRVEDMAKSIEGINEATVQYRQGRLELSVNEERGWNRDAWKTVAEQLRAALQKGQPDTSSIALAQIVDADKKGSLNPFDQYAMVEMYFREGRYLPLAVKAVKHDPHLNGKVDSTVAEMVTQLQSFSEARLAALGAVRLTLALMCLISLIIIQVMRCSQRRTEAGMLRVMGIHWWDLQMIVALDALQVWGVGALAGIVIGMGLGTWRARHLFSNPIEAALGFSFSCNDIGFLLLTSLMISVISAFVAAYGTWLRDSPADMVR